MSKLSVGPVSGLGLKRAPRRKNSVDAVGCVVVSIVLKNPKTGSHTVGNITRSFSLEETRVSVVAAKLEEVLQP